MADLRASLGLGRFPLLVLGVLVAVFLVVPLLIIIPTSWTSGAFLEFPPKGFSTQWYEQVFQDPKWIDPIKVSLRVSLFASLLATVMGTCAALGLRRVTRGRGVRFARSLFILPLALPYVSYALGMYTMFNHLPSSLASSVLPLILAQATITFPLVYVVVSGALANVDPNLSRAASTMGARWPTIAFRVELPLIRASVIGGWVFAFATCFDEATLAIFLSPVTDTTLAQQLYRSASESIEPTLSAVSTVVTLAALLVLGLGSLFINRFGAARRRPAT
jgi:putative spermidine/putrescine transport system permease protein